MSVIGRVQLLERSFGGCIRVVMLELERSAWKYNDHRAQKLERGWLYGRDSKM